MKTIKKEFNATIGPNEVNVVVFYVNTVPDRMIVHANGNKIYDRCMNNCDFNNWFDRLQKEMKMDFSF